MKDTAILQKKSTGGKFSGKVFLELGTNVASVDIVKYAKSEGAYVIVTDYLPTEKSEAKQYADETAMISTLDVDALIKFAKEKKIDGVFCGVSEQNLLSVHAVAKELNLPCYFTQGQWNVFQNKAAFKNLCEEYGVPVAKSLIMSISPTKEELGSIDFPVIVKPTDSGANMGISICHSKMDISPAITKALSFSKEKKVIVEKFIEGIEISCTYVVKKGVCKLVCMGSKYAYINNSGLKALAHAYIYPSQYLKEYIEKLDCRVVTMLNSQHLNNCTVFFQGIYHKGEFYFFEAGLRMEGTASYNITKEISGQNFMEFMVDNTMSSNSNYDLSCEDPTFGGKTFVKFSQIAKGGKIKKIEGYENIISSQMILSSEQRHGVGDVVIEDGTLRQHMFRYVIFDPDIEEIFKMIKRIQNEVKVYDENGNNMLIDDFKPEIIIE